MSMYEMPQWITPACAGKRRPQNIGTTGRRDHPRVCGDKLFQLPKLIRELGSPPRVRGKARHCQCPDLHPRITPACAGKAFFTLPL